MNRSEIHSLGDRTFLIVQADAVTIAAPTVIALPVTTLPQRAGYPLTVALDPLPALPGPAWVKVTAPQTLAQRDLAGPLARLDTATMDQVDLAILAVLGLENL